MVEFTINNRPDIKRAFYRLLGIGPNDDALTEYDSEAEETVHYFIQHGLWNAQYWLLTNTPIKNWISAHGPIVTDGSGNGTTIFDWSGSDSTGGQYVALPTDFIRLVGDEEDTALYTLSDFRGWGSEATQRKKHKWRGSSYYLENDRLYLALNARPKNNLYFDYYARHAELDDEADTLDFPIDIRPMIPAEAAVIALSESWLPFEDMDTSVKIINNLEYWRGIASSRGRRSRTPVKYRARHNPAGTNWL